MYSTFTNAVPEAMTIGKMLAAMKKLQAELELVPKAAFEPTEVRQSPLAMRTVPVKAHKLRHAQTEAYHKRIQKKWTKRYGTKQVPCAYMIDNTYLGGFGRTLVTHPSLLHGLR